MGQLSGNAIELTYDDSPLPVRGDLIAAHRRAWQRVASPGTWWTGEERVAIAEETRRATTGSLCLARKDALSPNAVHGDHDSQGKLPETLIDLIHRVRTDPGRLSRRWFDELASDGLRGHSLRRNTRSRRLRDEYRFFLPRPRRAAPCATDS